MVYFYYNIFFVVPSGKAKEVSAMFKAIHAQEDKPTAMMKMGDVIEKLKGMKPFKRPGKWKTRLLKPCSIWAFQGSISGGFVQTKPWRN